MDKISASEGIYGFCAWLTCRRESITLSEKHDAAPIVELINIYCKTNNLKEPRENYHHDLVMPVTTANSI